MVTRALADDFARFVGRIPAWVALAVSLALGVASVALLRTREWGRVDILDWSARGVVGAVGAAFVLGLIAIVADRTIGFPADINVAWPNVFVVYPVMAVVAEAVFHLAPLAVLTLVLGLDVAGPDASAATIVCLAAVALTETGYQVGASRRSAARPALLVFVVTHLAVIGAAQMLLLWRFGLAALLVFRLAYYACWHVIWGRLRLAP